MRIDDNAKCFNIDEDLDSAVDKAVEAYNSGEIFIYPTDTIYGFGGDPFNLKAVHRIYKIKGREVSKKFLMLIRDIDMLLKYVDIKNENHIDFLLEIWPNPLSVVLNLKNKYQELLGIETVAFRIPNHFFCNKLLQKIERPLASTSVNRSGKEPMNEYSMIYQEFMEEVDNIFYTERDLLDKASTIIDLTDERPRLLREGKLRYQEIISKFEEIYV